MLDTYISRNFEVLQTLPLHITCIIYPLNLKDGIRQFHIHIVKKPFLVAQVNIDYIIHQLSHKSSYYSALCLGIGSRQGTYYDYTLVNRQILVCFAVVVLFSSGVIAFTQSAFLCQTSAIKLGLNLDLQLYLNIFIVMSTQTTSYPRSCTAIAKVFVFLRLYIILPSMNMFSTAKP